MLAILTVLAEVIGFVVLGAVAVLLLAMAGSYLHDLIRTRNLRYDLYLYDDVARWNRRWRKRADRQKAHYASTPAGETPAPAADHVQE